jgi:RNA polymerase-interacting CarD/CdnL/TRCF family regulator
MQLPKEAVLRFASGDQIVHAQHGVGKVIGLELQRFSEEVPRAYYEIAIGSGTVWVPAEGASHALRKVTPRAELPRYRGVLRGKPMAVASDTKALKVELSVRVRETSFRAKCELVRDLTAHGWNKPLNESSGATLRNVRQALCSEWAIAEGVTVEIATKEVDALLLESKGTFQRRAFAP